MKRGRLPEAEEALTKALAMMGGHPDPLFNLAELHEKTGDKAKLARDIKQLEKIEEHLSDDQRDKLKKIKSNL